MYTKTALLIPKRCDEFLHHFHMHGSAQPGPQHPEYSSHSKGTRPWLKGERGLGKQESELVILPKILSFVQVGSGTVYAPTLSSLSMFLDMTNLYKITFQLPIVMAESH